MPSRATIKWLAAAVLIASLVSLQFLSADYNCGAQTWSCATLVGIAFVSVLAGVAFGSLVTAAIVLLGAVILLVRPSALAPETKARSGLVAINLVVLHLLAFGLMQILGVLPLGWVWWLGAFGAFGMHPPGAVYLIQPR